MPSNAVVAVMPAGNDTPLGVVSWMRVTYVAIARAHVSQRYPPSTEVPCTMVTASVNVLIGAVGGSHTHTAAPPPRIWALAMAAVIVSSGVSEAPEAAAVPN